MFEHPDLDDSPASAIDLPAASPVRPGTSSVARTFGSQTRTRARSQEENGDPGWLKYCLDMANRSVVKELRFAAQFPESPAALARLAHAELAAGSSKAAIESAIQCVDLVCRLIASEDEDAFDLGSVFGSIKVLMYYRQHDSVAEILGKLPSHSLLTRIRAELAADAGDWEQALSYLSGVSSPESKRLRGYLYLQTGRPDLALTQLRSAAQESPDDAKVIMNMAIAFWRMGSAKKAVRFAKRAQMLAPRDIDVLSGLVGFLIATGRPDTAEHEIATLLKDGVVETPGLLVTRAKIALVQNQVPRGRTLLNRAQQEYRLRGQNQQAAEVQGNLIMLRAFVHELSLDSARTEIGKMLQRNPEIPVLVAIYADLMSTVSMANLLRPYIISLPSDTTDHLALSARARYAYLECRFDDAAELYDLWSRADHFNRDAASQAFLLKAQVFDDFDDAADLAVQALSRFSWTPGLANDAAYVLALAGRPDVARKALKPVTTWTYVLKATSGLVEISDGNIDAGLRLYREAAALAEDDPDSSAVHALMMLHQTCGLHRLGVMTNPNQIALVAMALPQVELPDDWEQLPHFRLLYEIALRHGWNWPMVVS